MVGVFRAVVAVVSVVAGVLAVWDLWGRFVQGGAEGVPYTVEERDGSFERRSYPDLVVASTVAGSEREAFGRLFEYIDGANESAVDVPMTAPVASVERESVEMTAPVVTSTTAGGVEMSFFLPESYTLEGAPRPTSGDVSLDRVPHREVGVVRFSWLATDRRVRRFGERLDAGLADRNLTPVGDPELYRYDDPRTPPWQRRNELVVELA